MRTELVAGLALAALTVAAPARAADPWQELALMPWGDGEGQVGLHPGGEDELAYGPHGLALDGAGRIAVVDRVGGRALVFAADGTPGDHRRLEGRPGAAALLPDGELAVLDEAEERTVRRTAGGVLFGPRWALPPSRLLVTQGPDGPEIHGLDAFQQQLELAPLPGAVEPHEPPRGIPSAARTLATAAMLTSAHAPPGGSPAADGTVSVVALRDDDEVVLRFLTDGDGAEELRLAASLAEGERLAGVEVLAASGDGVVISYLGIAEGTGPLRTRRVVGWIGRDGVAGSAVDVPEPGPVAIPVDLAATADGRVVLLRSDTDGCRLWATRVGEGER